MESKPNRTVQVLVSVGAVFYLIFIVLTVLIDSYPIFRPFGIHEALLFIFLVGLILVWMNKKVAAGILFMIWNAMIWFWELYLSRSMDYGMLSALASSFMFLGAFLFLDWFKSSRSGSHTEPQQWKFMLRVLLVNYTVLYTIVVFSELTVGEPVNYSNYPFIIYPALYLLFWTAVAFSWHKEFITGVLLLFWSVVVITINITYSEISTLGGWVLFSLPVLLQGAFYVKNHFRFNINSDPV